MVKDLVKGLELGGKLGKGTPKGLLVCERL